MGLEGLDSRKMTGRGEDEEQASWRQRTEPPREKAATLSHSLSLSLFPPGKTVFPNAWDKNRILIPDSQAKDLGRAALALPRPQPRCRMSGPGVVLGQGGRVHLLRVWARLPGL